jgi:hypothetical protein
MSIDLILVAGILGTLGVIAGLKEKSKSLKPVKVKAKESKK